MLLSFQHALENGDWCTNTAGLVTFIWVEG